MSLSSPCVCAVFSSHFFDERLARSLSSPIEQFESEFPIPRQFIIAIKKSNKLIVIYSFVKCDRLKL